MRAEISWALYFLPSMSIDHDVPMWRLTDRMVRSGLVMAWRLATSPTRTSPDFENPTTDGVVRPPSALGMTTGSPASKTLTTELVVPRSMPTAFAMKISLIRCLPRRPFRGVRTHCNQCTELSPYLSRKYIGLMLRLETPMNPWVLGPLFLPVEDVTARC